MSDDISKRPHLPCVVCGCATLERFGPMIYAATKDRVALCGSCVLRIWRHSEDRAGRSLADYERGFREGVAAGASRALDGIPDLLARTTQPLEVHVACDGNLEGCPLRGIKSEVKS